MHQPLEGMLGTEGPWRLTTLLRSNPLVAGLLGSSGRSQRKGQGGWEHSTWGEVAGWGNDYVLTSTEGYLGTCWPNTIFELNT